MLKAVNSALILAVTCGLLLLALIPLSAQEDLTSLDLNSLRRMAEGGNATAQDELATRYHDGVRGLGQDYTQARNWSQKAASQGNHRSEYLLGVMYHYGEGVPQDFAQARIWYQKAADSGYAPSQVNLAYFYAEGRGVARDYAKARLLYEEAANQGNRAGQVNLGSLYERGEGVPQDYVLAASWYKKAADQGVISGQFYLGSLYERGLGVPKDYALAASWYQKAADKGFNPAEYAIGRMYDVGNGVPQNYAMARQWYLKAADKGNAFAQNNLGWLYWWGRGVPQDYSQSRAWFQKAADQGAPASQLAIASMYEHGLGVPKDLALASEWYQKAAEHGIGLAQDALKRLNSSSGVGCDPNWSPKLDPLTPDPNGFKAAIRQQLDGLITQFGGLDGAVAQNDRDVESSKEQLVQHQSMGDQDGVTKLQALVSMSEAIGDILRCRQSIAAQNVSAGNQNSGRASGPINQTAGTQNSPVTHPVTTAIDIRFTQVESRPLSDAEMAAVRDSLRWDPESAPLPSGGTAVSNLVDKDGHRLGSIRIQWNKTVVPKGTPSHPGGPAHGYFVIQSENGTSCSFSPRAELDDPGGFTVISEVIFASWMTLNDARPGQTRQAQGDADLPNQNASIVFKLEPLKYYSPLSGCTTPKNP